MTEGILESPLHVNDEAGLARVDGLLHDETFDLDGIEHDKAKQVVTIPVRRQFHGGPERVIDASIVSKTFEKDWMRSRVTIRHVKAWETERDHGINSYSFCSLRFSEGELVIECNEELVLTFTVSALDVEVEDIGFKGKARIKRGPLGVETSWSKVHE